MSPFKKRSEKYEALGNTLEKAVRVGSWQETVAAWVPREIGISNEARGQQLQL